MLARRTNLLPGSMARAALEPMPSPVISRSLWFGMSSDEREAYVRKIWPGDMTIAQAADEVGTSYGILANIARRLKLPRRIASLGWRALHQRKKQIRP
jgi:hypothetical protein